jgi:hypothetical protein
MTTRRCTACPVQRPAMKSWPTKMCWQCGGWQPWAAHSMPFSLAGSWERGELGQRSKRYPSRYCARRESNSGLARTTVKLMAGAYSTTRPRAPAFDLGDSVSFKTHVPWRRRASAGSSVRCAVGVLVCSLWQQPAARADSWCSRGAAGVQLVQQGCS